MWRHLFNNIMYFLEKAQLRHCFLSRVNWIIGSLVLALLSQLLTYQTEAIALI